MSECNVRKAPMVIMDKCPYSSVFCLNQARAWFLEIVFVREVGMVVCVSAPKATINIHVILNLHNQLNKFVALEM